jgi:hypothetical protein
MVSEHLPGQPDPMPVDSAPADDPSIGSLHTPSDRLTEREQSGLKGTDFGTRSRWSSVYDVIDELHSYGDKNSATQLLGLPTDSTWEQIELYMMDQDRLYQARQFDLPEDAPLHQIEEFLQKERDELLAEKARSLGLPETATKAEVADAERRQRASAVGLSPESPWPEIYHLEMEQRQRTILDALGLAVGKPWSWETILMRALCMGEHATVKDIITRIQSIRIQHVTALVQEVMDETTQSDVEIGGS